MNAWINHIEAYKPQIIELEKILFAMPELGFFEVRTQETLKDFFDDHGLKISEDYGVNGFRVTIGEGYPHIGLIAELDALVVPSHFTAQKPVFAAHACGHHLQSTIMAFVMMLWFKHNDHQIPGRLSLFAVAAEEFVDLDNRLKLQAAGTIQLLSGKQNLLIDQKFGDVDMLLSAHTMGTTAFPQMEINSRLSGFIYKKINFIGRSAHAAVAPHLGVNALNAMVLAQNGIALLRETFQEKDLIRVHLLSSLGGQSVNAVPSQTTLEGYVRAINNEALYTLNEQIDHVVSTCAKALYASCEIEDRVGYAPLHQSKELNEVLKRYMIDCVGEKGIVDNQSSFAAGDIGDCSLFYPTIQFGFSGCQGVVHGADFCMKNPDEALVYPIYVLLSTIEELLSNPDQVQMIQEAFKPMITLEQYRQVHKV